MMTSTMDKKGIPGNIRVTMLTSGNLRWILMQFSEIPPTPPYPTFMSHCFFSLMGACPSLVALGASGCIARICQQCASVSENLNVIESGHNCGEMNLKKWIFFYKEFVG